MAYKINPYIYFYKKYNISPVHQNIRDFSAHLGRREKLFSALGLPPAFFSGKTILEVGPGGGYNTLAYFHWGAKVDLIEPNPKGREGLVSLFRKFKINKTSWRLFEKKVEKFSLIRNYDLVIAEGFLPGLYNRKNVIKKIRSAVKPGGVAVVSCVDDISFFFEELRRLLAWRLIGDIHDFDLRVKVLSEAFVAHLASLKFTTRSINDWVIDQLLNPASHGRFFSIADAIQEFGEEFYLLGSSPRMFTDYSWYKDLTFDTQRNALNQFYSKWHVLMLQGLPESLRNPTDNKKLELACRKLRRFSRKAENNFNKINIARTVILLRKICKLSANIDKRIPLAINEVIRIMQVKDLKPKDVARARRLVPLFGKGQQYISLVKCIK